METETIKAAVGAATARIRKDAGLTQVQLSAQIERYGLTFPESRVRDLERGKRGITLGLLIALTASLGHLTGQQLRLADMLGDAEYLELDKGFTIRRDAVARFLTGEDVAIDARHRAPGDLSPDTVRAVQAITADVVGNVVGFPALVQMAVELAKSQLVDAPDDYEAHKVRNEIPPTYAETRLARRLEVEPQTVATWAWYLWQATLDDEAARLAGEGSTPQARGHQTRLLGAQIEDAIRRQRESAGEAE